MKMDSTPHFGARPITVQSGDYIEQLKVWAKLVQAVRGKDEVTPLEWERIDGYYRGLRQLTPKAEWRKWWATASRFKDVVKAGKPVLETWLCFIEYEALYDRFFAAWAKRTGFWKRDYRRKCKRPGYQAANTERQRKRRARLKAEREQRGDQPGEQRRA